jgi:hypothetical protein
MLTNFVNILISNKIHIKKEVIYFYTDIRIIIFDLILNFQSFLPNNTFFHRNL